MVGGIRLALTLGDGEVVELIRRHRWPDGVRCPYCGSVVIKNGRPAGGFTLNDTYARAVGGSSTTLAEQYSLGIGLGLARH